MHAHLPHLSETVTATARLLEDVARMTDDDVRTPSVLPGWTRGHVVTHVARNADAVAACGRWRQAALELPAEAFENPMSRLPGAATRPVRGVGTMRRTEVEVHHADLAVGWTAADWPTDFVAALMGRRQSELAAAGVGLRWQATDTGERWESGPGPEVTGRAADLVWWLVGRGSGEGLACSDDRLPELGRWA